MRTEALEALSGDIHLLGGLLGEAIRRLAGEPAFELVEEVRAASKDLRGDASPESARRLRDRLGELGLSDLRTLIRAFSVYFDLTNLAEQQARVRAIRVHLRAADPTWIDESPESALRQLRDRGIDADQIVEHLERALICPVFTAHPSEAIGVGRSSKSSRASPTNSTAWRIARSSLGSMSRPLPRSPRRSRPSGSRTRFATRGRASRTKSARASAWSWRTCSRLSLGSIGRWRPA